MNKLPKLLISAGGKGSRVSRLTGGNSPKSLASISPHLSLPLLSYQLQVAQAAGIREVLVAFDNLSHVKIFRDLMAAKKVPKLHYVIVVTPHSPFEVFQLAEAKSFIANSDFVWSLGDLFYFPQHLENLQRIATQQKTCVASYGYLGRGAPGQFMVDSRGRVVPGQQHHNTKETTILLGAPVYFLYKTHLQIVQYAARLTNQIEPLFEFLAANAQLSACHSRSLINMNYPEDIDATAALIEEYLLDVSAK